MVNRDDLTQDDLDATIGEVLVEDNVSSIETDDRILFVPIGMESLDVALAEHGHEKQDRADCRKGVRVRLTNASDLAASATPVRDFQHWQQPLGWLHSLYISNL